MDFIQQNFIELHQYQVDQRWLREGPVASLSDRASAENTAQKPNAAANGSLHLDSDGTFGSHQKEQNNPANRAKP